MTYRFSEVDFFESFCSDTSANNCYDYADGAVPVYLDSDGDGDPVLTTVSGRFERPYGYLYTLHDPGDGARTVVVRA